MVRKFAHTSFQLIYLVLKAVKHLALKKNVN